MQSLINGCYQKISCHIKSIRILPQFGSVAIGGYAHTDELMLSFSMDVSKVVTFPNTLWMKRKVCHSYNYFA
jgi:hypothetical protein